MFRIAIVEDEEKSETILIKHIDEYTQRTGCLFSCTWFKNGLSFISDYEPNYDIIFLDIKMPHLNGLEAARQLRKRDKNVVLIFVTNLMQFAIKGYEVNALDFMLKPVKYYDLEMKLTKAIDYVNKHQNRSIVIDSGGVITKLSILEIYYIEVLNHTLIYHTENGNYKTYGQLKSVELKLENSNYTRCNNSYLINLKHVSEVHSEYIIVGKDKAPISRRKKKEFMEKLVDYMGGGI